MKLKRINVDGYRCLLNVEIIFEDDLTVIVGENDCGKSSITKCINLISSNDFVEIGDFNYRKDEIKIEAESKKIRFN